MSSVSKIIDSADTYLDAPKKTLAKFLYCLFIDNRVLL